MTEHITTTECDPDAAIGRLGGDLELYRDLLKALFGGASGYLERLRSAVTDRDGKAIHHSAHGIKGLAATCGANEVVRRAEDLEELGRSLDVDRAVECLAALERSLTATESTLSRFLHEHD